MPPSVRPRPAYIKRPPRVEPDLFLAASATGEGKYVLAGEVLRLTYENADNGFIVGALRATDGATEVYFRGWSLPNVREGMTVSFEGRWEEHPEYGQQFVVSSVRTELPIARDAIVRYIKKNVKGCGEAMADRLIEHFGPNALRILLANPERVKEAVKTPGLQKKTFEAFQIAAQKYTDNRATEIVYKKLMSVGTTSYSRAARIVRTFGPAKAEEIVLYRPYDLVQVGGIGFKTADAMARESGVALNDPTRIAAGVVYVLELAMQQEGHSGLPRRLLEQRAKRELEVDDVAAIERAVDAGLKAGTVIERYGLIFKAQVDALEDEVARAIVKLSRRRRPLTPAQIATVDAIIKEAHIDPLQAKAVRDGLECGLSILTGRPGTGKTTTLRTYLAAAKALGDGDSIALAAPTGKAASRASQVTGYPAVTAHRLVGVPFGQTRKSPLPYRRIALDEMSMSDLGVVAWLLRNVDLDHCFVSFIGDHNQLPSVQHGQVLADCIGSGSLNVVELREIHRQGKGSLIRLNAHHLLDREPLDLSNAPDSDFWFADVSEPVTRDENGFPVDDPDKSARERKSAQARLVRAVRHFIDERGAVPVRDLQVLTPMKKGDLGVAELNRIVQQVVNPDGEVGPYLGDGVQVRVGDRVIQTKNNKEKGVFNGDQGEVISASASDRKIRVRFEDRELEYNGDECRHLFVAWAITVHRSQGSEFPYVILAYHTSHFKMLSRRLLYTAVTRAQKHFLLLGNRWALNHTLRMDTEAEVRYTALGDRIRSYASGAAEMSAAPPAADLDYLF